MTQENHQGMESVSQAARLADEIKGSETREQVKIFLSTFGGNLPSELTLPGHPDIHLLTETCVLVNVLSSKPRPLSDIAWFILRNRITVTLEQVTSQSFK